MKSSYAYLLAPILGFLTAQVLKFLLADHKTRTWRNLFSSGNMPSGHTTVVTAISTVIFANEGISNLFALSMTLSILTIYDALVARRSIGEQGQALIRLIEKSPFAKDPMPRVALGHKPKEVVAGALLGALIGLIVAFFIT